MRATARYRLSYDSDAFSNAALFVSLTLKASPLQAVFGTFGSLSLKFAKGTVASIAAAFAQDLRGDASTDVTKLVGMDSAEETVTLSGELIASVGTAAKTPGDLSEPGLVLSLTTK